LSSADIFQTRAVLQMRTSALFGAKDLGFFEIYGVSARTRGGLSQCGHFAVKEGGGSIFFDFVPTFFMDGPKILPPTISKILVAD